MLSLSRRFAFAFTLLPLIVVCPSFYRNHAIIFSRKEASDAPGYASEGAEKEPFGMSKNLFLKMLRKVQNIAVNSRISGVKETHFNTRKFLRSCFLPENFLLFSGFLLGFFLFFLFHAALISRPIRKKSPARSRAGDFCFGKPSKRRKKSVAD